MGDEAVLVYGQSDLVTVLSERLRSEKMDECSSANGTKS